MLALSRLPSIISEGKKTITFFLGLQNYSKFNQTRLFCCVQLSIYRYKKFLWLSCDTHGRWEKLLSLVHRRRKIKNYLQWSVPYTNLRSRELRRRINSGLGSVKSILSIPERKKYSSLICKSLGWRKSRVSQEL